MTAALRTVAPTGRASWPRILLSGEAGAGLAWTAADFSRDSRLGGMYWLSVAGEDAHALGAVDGARYDILDHDGTWSDLYEQVCAAWDVAHAAVEAGGLPVALTVDSMSGIRAMLAELADTRARRRTAGALAARGLDPAPAYSSEVEVLVGADLWTLVGGRHRQLMGKILTWPGPVVMTAREQVGADGRWSLRAQDGLEHDVTAWVRCTRDDLPEILRLDVPRRGRLSPAARAELRREYSLRRLVWDWCGCTSETRAPQRPMLDADQVLPGEQPLTPVAAPPVRTARPVRRAPVAALPTPPAVESGRRVANLLDRFLALGTRSEINALWDSLLDLTDDERDTDVSGLITPDIRAGLGIPDGPCTLHALATEAARRVHRTGQPLVVAGAAETGAA